MPIQAGSGSIPLPHRNQLALSFALLAALFWGLLPLALQIVVPVLDTYTITWCRFLAAGICVGLFLARRSSLPRPWRLAPNLRLLIPIAVVGLTLNYTLVRGRRAPDLARDRAGRHPVGQSVRAARRP